MSYWRFKRWVDELGLAPVWVLVLLISTGAFAWAGDWVVGQAPGLVTDSALYRSGFIFTSLSAIVTTLLLTQLSKASEIDGLTPQEGRRVSAIHGGKVTLFTIVLAFYIVVSLALFGMGAAVTPYPSVKDWAGGVVGGMLGTAIILLLYTFVQYKSLQSYLVKVYQRKRERDDRKRSVEEFRSHANGHS